jgi:glycosyltransferase involved in cell wall biosynthesis
MKEKIAFVCPRSPREVYAGIENYAFNLTKQLKKKYDVVLYCTAKEPKMNVRLNGIRVFEFKEDNLPFGVHYYSGKLVRELKKSDAKIIHACGYNTMVPWMALKAKKGFQKLVITLASSKSSSKTRNLLEKIYFQAIKAMAKKIDWFIALSEFEKNEFQKHFKKIPFEVIPIAIEQKNSLKIKRKKKQILSVGRMVKNKGFEYVIDAFKETLKRDNEFNLILVGDGENRRELERRAKKYGIENKIIFTGSVGEKEHQKITSLMQESTVFIFLSNYESQGVVVGEAIVAGAPVIVANTSAIKEFAECGLAFAFKQKESEKIAEKIIEIAKNPENFVPKNNLIKKCYLIKNWKQVGKETEKVYEKLLGLN